LHFELRLATCRNRFEKVPEPCAQTRLQLRQLRPSCCRASCGSTRPAHHWKYLEVIVRASLQFQATHFAQLCSHTFSAQFPVVPTPACKQMLMPISYWDPSPTSSMTIAIDRWPLSIQRGPTLAHCSKRTHRT